VHVSIGGGEDEIAGIASVGGTASYVRRGAGKAQHDPAGFCAGRDAEVVFELSLTAVVDEIDAVVNATVFYTAILGNVVTPFRRIIADVITALSREVARRKSARRNWLDRAAYE